ncbi:MAG: hypothetical protein RQ847_11080, partial [Wenzhouxiangellaceae bacterium]|nr:hypothetical protein [Wenzhouxiangellaceae bacterium]
MRFSFLNERINRFGIVYQLAPGAPEMFPNFRLQTRPSRNSSASGSGFLQPVPKFAVAASLLLHGLLALVLVATP